MNIIHLDGLGSWSDEEVERGYEKLDEKDRKIIELQEDLRMAEHRAFAAEVKERRANQKRRNQKSELRRLHAAINEKNNRIRNLEIERSILNGTLVYQS